jgi:hypothetical protein
VDCCCSTWRPPDRGRRAEEVHTLDLFEPADVLATLRDAGFAAQALPEGYAGVASLPGVTAYLGRRGQ